MHTRPFPIHQDMLERRLPAVVIALVVALTGLVPQFLSRTLPDISFLLYAAGRVLDGARLYVDVIEINPPLIVWLNMPVVAAARALAVSDVLLYRLVVTGLLVGSVFASGSAFRLTREGQHPVVRRLAVVMIVFVLFVLPRLDWGEREHLTLALTLPYVLLAVARLQSRTVSVPAAVGIGIAAAVGIAIKPQFVLLWVAREMLVSVRTRRPSIEGAVVAGCGAVYLAAAAVLTPEYFILVRELGPAYQVYLHNTLAITALLGDGAALAIGSVLVAFGLWRRSGSAELRLTLIAAVAASYVAAVIQQKGWRYHFYPALALGWMLLGVVALSTLRPVWRWTERLFHATARAAVATVAIAAIVGSLVQAVRPLDPRYDADPSIGALISTLEPHVRGRPLMVVSSNMASGFPLTTYTGAVWPQRFSNLWPLVAAYDSALDANDPFSYRPAGAMTALERRLLATVSADFRRADPPIVAVLHPGPDHVKWGMRRLDLLEFLRRDSAFAERFASYDSVGIVGQYIIYERSGLNALERPLPMPRAEPGGESAPNSVAVAPGSLLLGTVFLILLAFSYRATRAISRVRMARDAA